MTTHASIFFAQSDSKRLSDSVFANQQPLQPLVREVVSFPPAANQYSDIEKAAERIAAGKSVFYEQVPAISKG
jgi:hypothetical protein